MTKRKYLLWGILLITGAYIARLFFNTRLLSIHCGSERGIVDIVESSNLGAITSPRHLKKLLSAAEYQQALDTSQYYSSGAQANRTWRARDYFIYNDSLIIAKNFSAKLILMQDNALVDTANGDREYFFQIRTYTKNDKLIDKTDFATWSRAKNEFCDGVLTDDYYLIRSCDGSDQFKRINQAGYFILPSKRTVIWLKLRGY